MPGIKTLAWAVALLSVVGRVDRKTSGAHLWEWSAAGAWAPDVSMLGCSADDCLGPYQSTQYHFCFLQRF